MPASRSDRCAATVVSRSSDNRTGVGAMRRASWSASSIASLADETGPVGEGARQSHHHFDSLQLVGQLRQPAHVLVGLVPSVPLHRLHGCGQDPVRIAGGHPDAHRAHVDTEPSTAAGIVAPGPIRQTVIGIGHGLAPAYFCA